MKAIEVLKLLEEPESYITEFYDYTKHKRELSLIVNDADIYDLHWKVFNQLLENKKIYQVSTISTELPSTETVYYKSYSC